MSSWSGSHLPPPRRSRSRSPSRGAYGRMPYPDTFGYPQDPYRPDWDPYNRERPWMDWERDRAGYDYPRRGRSRSPPFDETGRKRRRSLSPYERERYEPRPRYNDDYDTHSRAHGYTSPRSRSQYGHSYSRNSRGPVDPHTLDYPATLKQYAEWFRYNFPQQASEEDIADKAAEQEAGDGSKPRNGIKARWEKYKKEFTATQLQTLFEHHKKSPWFAEKYDPSSEFVTLRTRVRKDGWKAKISQFMKELDEGTYDQVLTEPEVNTPVSPMKDIKDESAVVAESGLNMPTLTDNKEEDGFAPEVADEILDMDSIKTDANGKGVQDGRHSARSDEITVSPEGNQVMIRTIPPDIGRLKLENIMKDLDGFIYLALGDPMQKRNYYRAGWIKFRDDADAQTIVNTLSERKIEGFKLHVNHNIRPFTGRIRQTPEVASKPERIVKDLDQAKRLVAVLEGEYEKVMKFKPTKLEPPRETEAQTEETPNITEVDARMQEENLEEEVLIEKGSIAVERRIAKLVAELPASSDEEDAEDAKLKKNTIALDLYLAYLRAAFHTCYYCASVSDHLEEMQRKCIKHVRKPLSKQLSEEAKEQDLKHDEGDDKAGDKEKEKENSSKEKFGDLKDWKRNDDRRWLDWLDNKVALLINRDGIDVRDYGGKDYADELSKAVEPHIKQEDEGKFRCKTCTKLFKATSFVEKHIANKHPELVKQLADIPYFNNFALDPQRIQPFSHPPSTTGHSQAPPPQAYGLPGPPVYVDPPRPAPYYGLYPPAYPPSYVNGGQWDHHGYQYGSYPPVPMRSLRDEPPLSSGGGRRLSDRISGYAYQQDAAVYNHGIEGLPPKPTVTLEPGLGGRRGRPSGPPPPPPPDAKEDPRAAAGKKVSYHDMDLVAEGDVELSY